MHQKCPFHIHRHNNGVTMGSPLGQILAGIFMVELENTVVSKLEQHGSTDYVLSVLGTFHTNIKFTHKK